MLWPRGRPRRHTWSSGGGAEAASAAAPAAVNAVTPVAPAALPASLRASQTLTGVYRGPPLAVPAVASRDGVCTATRVPSAWSMPVLYIWVCVCACLCFFRFFPTSPLVLVPT